LILVTHEPDIADYADRVVVFKDGKIKSDYQIESPRNAAEELKRLPAVEFDDDDDGSEEEVRTSTSRGSDRVGAGPTSKVQGKVNARTLAME
jgi:ABC-type sulfate/molybdate transport systems ATPase subunit